MIMKGYQDFEQDKIRKFSKATIMIYQGDKQKIAQRKLSRRGDNMTRMRNSQINGQGARK